MFLIAWQVLCMVYVKSVVRKDPDSTAVIMFLRTGLITQFLLIGLSMFAIAADSALPTVDSAAPDFALKDVSGTNVRLSELRTEVVIINFWSSWCRSCRSEMPKLNELHAEFADTDVRMMGVNVDDDPAAVRRALNELQPNYSVLFDDQHRVSKLYDLPMLPVTLLIDRTGQLRFVHQGYRVGNEKFYKDELSLLLAE
jgi:peroxiredoxin